MLYISRIRNQNTEWIAQDFVFPRIHLTKLSWGAKLRKTKTKVRMEEVLCSAVHPQ